MPPLYATVVTSCHLFSRLLMLADAIFTLLSAADSAMLRMPATLLPRRSAPYADDADVVAAMMLRRAAAMPFIFMPPENITGYMPRWLSGDYYYVMMRERVLLLRTRDIARVLRCAEMSVVLKIALLYAFTPYYLMRAVIDARYVYAMLLLYSLTLQRSRAR